MMHVPTWLAILYSAGLAMFAWWRGACYGVDKSAKFYARMLDLKRPKR